MKKTFLFILFLTSNILLSSPNRVLSKITPLRLYLASSTTGMVLGGVWGAKNLKETDLTNYEKISTGIFVGAITGASLPFSLPIILAERSLRK